MKHGADFLSQAKKLGSLTLVSSLLGLVRELAIARKFGATHATDSYLVALSIPTVLYALFIGSGLNLAVIPQFASRFARDPGSAAKIFSEFLSATALLGAVVSILILVFPTPLVRIFAPGLASSILSAQFTRMLSPLFFLLVVAYSLGSLQCARNHTPFWGLIGTTQNAVLVAVIFLLGRILGVQALMVGTITGAAVALAVQIALASRAGFAGVWSLPSPRGEAMGTLRTLLPFALAFGVGGDSGTSQADIFLMRYFASRLAPGSITLLTLGNKLMGLPVLLVGSAIGLALLPSASIQIAEDDVRGASDRLVQALSYALLLVCPIVVFYLNISDPIVGMIFGHGALTAVQLLELGGILRAYTGALAGLTLVYVLASFLAALRCTRVLIAAGIFTVLLNLALMSILVTRYGAKGIALAISVGSLVYCCILLTHLTRHLGWPLLARLLRSGALILAGAFGMYLVLIVTRRLVMLTAVPWMSRDLIPALVALTPYLAWMAWHRGRFALRESP